MSLIMRGNTGWKTPIQKVIIGDMIIINCLKAKLIFFG